MKHVTTTVLLAVLFSLSLNAQNVRPVIFDDPTFDIQSPELTPEQRSFFDQYVLAMQRIEAGEDAEKFFVMERTNDADGIVVAPLLGEINFNQGNPYNKFCPYINGGRAVTGCVATAMAMIMRYYNFPAKGTGSVKYTGGSDGEQTFVLDDHPFDWPNILPTYDFVNYTTEQADAVANLMLACGAALQMNYSKDGSGAQTERVPGLLKNNFFFSSDVRYIDVSNSSNPEQDITYWGEDVVRPDLELGRPLIFAGHPAIGQTGHCFVVDGYKIENGLYYYHVNWGWGGAGNSWCLLTRLEDAEGSNYSGHNLSMVYYIHPNYPAAVEQVESSEAATKTLRDGQLIIQRNNATYSAQGQRIQ